MTLLVLLGIAAAGLLVGVTSAMFGVGGGIIMVPFMVLALEKTQHVAEGTSLLVVIPTAIAGVVFHRRRNLVQFRHAATMAVGGLAGAYGGALLALDLDGETLQAVFGAFLAVVALRTVRDGVRDMRTASRSGRAESEQEGQGPPVAARSDKA